MSANTFPFFTTPPPPKGMKESFIEDFEFGWNRQTTFDPVRADVLALLQLAEKQPATVQQVCLRAAVAMLVSGVESFACVALNSKHPPRQSLKAYNTALKEAIPDYMPPQGHQAMAVDRLFKARHAVVHNGSRATQKVAATTRVAHNSPLVFDAADLRKVLEHVVQFVTGIDNLIPNSDPLP